MISMYFCLFRYGRGGSAHAVMYDRKKFTALDGTQKNAKISLLLHESISIYIFYKIQ